jgi:flavin reductase (DIM6/NTAB) family NADH-FMN oxidoreductase RutF
VEADPISGPWPAPATPESPSAAAFRAVAGCFATGVTVITARAGGVDHAMTANAFTSVSLDPPLVLVCVERRTRFHAAVVGDGAVATGWAVSFLSRDGEAAARLFATSGRPLDGQMRGFGSSRGIHTDAVILDDVIGAMECRTTAVHDGGDHSIVIGEVLSVLGPVSGGRPLLYYRGAYRAIADGLPAD